MPGRPARMIKSDRCRPPIFESRSRRPVEMPDSLPSRWYALAAMSTSDFHRLREALEAAFVAAGFGEFVELAFGVLDLRARGKVHRRVEGDVDHVLADPDQVAAQRHVVDRAAVILRVDDRGGFGRDAGEVLANRHAADVGVGRQERLQRDGRGHLAHSDQAAGGLENGLMERFEEVFRLQEVGNPVERVVVDQDRAQQALLRLDIVRGAPIGRSSRVGGELEDVRISQGHDLGICFAFWRFWTPERIPEAGGDKAPLAGEVEG